MTATREREYRNTGVPAADFEGNVQQLSRGGVFTGWGQQPHFAEFDSDGRLVFRGRFVAPTANDRAYLLPWEGAHAARGERVAARRTDDGHRQLEWRHGVASWRVLASERRSCVRSRLRRTAGSRRGSGSAKYAYVSVQGLDRAGRVLATSAVAHVPYPELCVVGVRWERAGVVTRVRRVIEQDRWSAERHHVGWCAGRREMGLFTHTE